jgi:hypothetical protein
LPKPASDLREIEDPDANLREHIDLDSMEYPDLVIASTREPKRTEVDIPEADYPKLATLVGWVSH